MVVLILVNCHHQTRTKQEQEQKQPGFTKHLTCFTIKSHISFKALTGYRGDEFSMELNISQKACTFVISCFLSYKKFHDFS